MKKTKLISLLLLSPAVFSTTQHWGYSGKIGPEQWAKLTPEFSQCAGSNQSPVNLTGLVDAKLMPLEFKYQTDSMSVTNNGHTVQVNSAPGSMLLLDEMPFELKQFHFHTPSENKIQGKSYPLEAHLVHSNAKGELAVVSVLFEVGITNQAMAKAWQHLPNMVGEINQLKEPFSAEQLLPSAHDYYRFSGSLTTPPCSEGVRWLVLKKPLTVSQNQLDEFKTALQSPNNRPTQPLNGRLILQ